MKKVQPRGPYTFVGYSYGACIAFEMASILQQNEGTDAISKLVLLDGSPLYMQTYRYWNTVSTPISTRGANCFPPSRGELVGEGAF